MGEFIMNKLGTLNEVLVEQLKDLYSAESQLVKALPLMEKKASNEKLKSALQSHLKETQNQLRRLDEISALMNEKLTGTTCKAMKGLIEEGKEALEAESANPALIDSLLVAAARRVEHYEMAAYCTARKMAVELGEDGVADFLGETFEEEKNCDKALSAMLESTILPEASLAKGALRKQGRKSGIADAAKALTVAGMLAAGSFMVPFASAETQSQKNQEAERFPADNSGKNVRDSDARRVTAGSQKMSGPDMEVLANIRRNIIAQPDLSVNGRNVKVIVESGVVTLRGPVKSEEESRSIENATKEAASSYKIVNQLEAAAG